MAKKAEVAGGIGGVGLTRLGLKCSILREGAREVDLSTPLTAGEAVKLRIVPNVDGFLYVMEGGAVIASGAVKVNQQFETPDLKSDAAGQRQFQITLSRTAVAGGILDVGAIAAGRSNFIETNSNLDPGTYLVMQDAVSKPQQFVAPVTLTWR